MMDVQDQGIITKEAENKVTGAIFKVIKTSVDDFALACSGGLYFARYDSQNKRFTIAEDFLLSDHLVTQICEVAMNKFLVGIWGVPWVGYVDKTQKLLVKLNCPSDSETQCTDLATLPGFDINAFPYMIQRSSKAVNLINLSSMTMHKLLWSENQSGSFEKLAIDLSSSSENDQLVKLLYVNDKAKIIEATLDSGFIRNLKNLAST